MAYKDPEVAKAKDRERFRRRVERRKEAGLCLRCGDRPPAPERSVCAPCGDKRNRADRERDARLRAEGKPRRNRPKARQYERGRARRETAKRTALGLCIRCGQRPAMPGRKSCEPCLEKRREADRAKYAAGKAAGLPYGGADPDARKKYARARSKRRQKARTEAGLCIRCGDRPPAEGGMTCTPCRDKRQAAERRAVSRPPRRRALRALRRAGLRRSLALRPLRRRRGGQPEPGAQERALAQALRRTARARLMYILRSAVPGSVEMRVVRGAFSYHGSAHFRGIPVWDPSWTVIELETGREHGPFDSEADVALCLAFEKLDREEVEIVSDASPMSRYAAWS